MLRVKIEIINEAVLRTIVNRGRYTGSIKMTTPMCTAIVREGNRAGAVCSCYAGRDQFAEVCPHHSSRSYWYDISTPETCPCCHEDMTTIEWKSACCGRAFHVECLRAWLATHRSSSVCPHRCRAMHVNIDTREFKTHSINVIAKYYYDKFKRIKSSHAIDNILKTQDKKKEEDINAVNERYDRDVDEYIKKSMAKRREDIKALIEKHDSFKATVSKNDGKDFQVKLTYITSTLELLAVNQSMHPDLRHTMLKSIYDIIKDDGGAVELLIKDHDYVLPNPRTIS